MSQSFNGASFRQYQQREPSYSDSPGVSTPDWLEPLLRDNEYVTPPHRSLTFLDSPESQPDLDIRLGLYRMQLGGPAKRKRSSATNGDIENSPIEAKRPRTDERPGPVAGCSHAATEERQPLSELPVLQPLDDSDGSVGDWLEACPEDLSVSDEEDREGLGGNDAEDTPSCIDEDNEDGDNGGEEDKMVTPEQFRRTVDNFYNRQYPLDTEPDKIEWNVFSKKEHFKSKTEIMNFFRRRLRSGAEDRTDQIFCGNPGLQPKMRSVLLEWIVEVCDVYKLHRETYHLTVDYLDRYLCLSEDISKGQLQLIGVTALLIAAKYEEIYPPKIADFAYITDGACTDQDIIKMENLMVQVLEWRCTVITSNSYVLGLLQLLGMLEKEDAECQDVSIPQYNHLIYETIMHMLDLSSLDSGFVKFSYKVLAVSSIHIVVPNPNSVILKVSGYGLDDLTDCIEWLQPFWCVLCQKFNYKTVKADAIANIDPSGRAADFAHMRIKHNIDLDMLEAVQMMFEAKENSEDIPELLLTPPLSSEKRRESHN